MTWYLATCPLQKRESIIPEGNHILVSYVQENEQLKAMVGHLKSEEETNGAGAAACCGDADWQSFEFGEEEYCSSTNEV